MFYYVYILLSEKDNKRYIGYTDNLRRRIEEHSGKLVVSTRHRIPLKLIYYEACLDKKDAKRREKYLKGQWGYKFINKRLENFYQNL
ncbi:excinuclease ABC subunit C [Candidatus Shapirobacteria bacterium CG_4_10_14_0_8_um_filter_39_15]|nr:MAG: excinuclease ABC subunit C [Candidatus Shapirobacteria bacterium CG_4_10_14_0_8_um_filter_39_15]